MPPTIEGVFLRLNQIEAELNRRMTQIEADMRDSVKDHGVIRQLMNDRVEAVRDSLAEVRAEIDVVATKLSLLLWLVGATFVAILSFFVGSALGLLHLH